MVDSEPSRCRLKQGPLSPLPHQFEAPWKIPKKFQACGGKVVCYSRCQSQAVHCCCLNVEAKGEEGFEEESCNDGIRKISENHLYTSNVSLFSPLPLRSPAPTSATHFWSQSELMSWSCCIVWHSIWIILSFWSELQSTIIFDLVCVLVQLLVREKKGVLALMELLWWYSNGI